MKKFDGAGFAETHAWHGPDVAKVCGAEVFVVLDGVVDMHVRVDGREEIVTLNAGDVLHVENGDEHVAHPRGSARILVIEDPASG